MNHPKTAESHNAQLTGHVEILRAKIEGTQEPTLTALLEAVRKDAVKDFVKRLKGRKEKYGFVYFYWNWHQILQEAGLTEEDLK